MCRVYKIATFATLFSTLHLNLNSFKLQKLKSDTFADRLRYLRIKRNLNQHEFAKLVNYSFTSICNWEQGNRIPSEEALKEISEVLDIDYKYLKDSI